MKWDLRNLYETYTRDVRFKTYIQTAKIKQWDKFAIVLGHNHDDCIENILTNITTKSKYENLYGMEYSSQLDFADNKLNFIRPLLQITKSQIYEFAHYVNIPYLFDSTPSWSQRGQIRDIIRPNLIKWNGSAIEGLDELAQIMKSSMECVDILVETWITRISEYEKLPNYKGNNLEKFSKLLEINIWEFKSNKIFWNRFFTKINFNCSTKMLNEFIGKIDIIKKKFDLLQINQRKQIQISKQNKIIYWKGKSNKLYFCFEKI
jgi:tRNA(Ile)-lysidine synthase TilS/MesJ